jgi:hypothetical protein
MEGAYSRLVLGGSNSCRCCALPGESHLIKHCLKILKLKETLLNSVSNDLLPFMVGQSHECFKYTAECQGCDVISALSALRPFMCCARGTDRRLSEASLGVK